MDPERSETNSYLLSSLSTQKSRHEALEKTGVNKDGILKGWDFHVLVKIINYFQLISRII